MSDDEEEDVDPFNEETRQNDQNFEREVQGNDNIHLDVKDK